MYLAALGFEGMEPATTGRPAYHPSTMLEIYLYGYLNRVQSSRQLEQEAGCNIELMWLTGRLAPDFKTIANFRRDNGAGVRACAHSSCCYAGAWACSPAPCSLMRLVYADRPLSMSLAHSKLGWAVRPSSPRPSKTFERR